MDLSTPTPKLLLRHATSHPTKHTVPRPRGRIVYDFSTETLAQYMHLRQDEAAKALGIATITLKRICYRRQIRWPYRAYKAHIRRKGKQQVHSDTNHNSNMMKTEPGTPGGMNQPRVSTEVPPLKPRLLQKQYSSQRLTLPSLAETLGSPIASFPRTQFPAKERPHLPMIVDQPQREPIPSLPRISTLKPNSIFQTPTFASRSLKTELVPPIVSPTMTRFQCLPPIQFIRRTIG